MIAADGDGLVNPGHAIWGLGTVYADRPLRHRWLSNRVHGLGGGNGFV